MDHAANRIYTPTHAAWNLSLYAINDGAVFRRTKRIRENLRNLAAAGLYNADEAADALFSIIETLARKMEKSEEHRYTPAEIWTAARDTAEEYITD